MSYRGEHATLATEPVVAMQSAARSKERKEQYTVMLEGQVALLQAELANERAQMKQLQEDMETLGGSFC